MTKENDLSEKLKQNTLEQIQAIGDTFGNAVFDLFSQLQSNALDVQLANAQTQHETQMRLFDDRMERELQLAGDNEDAKAVIRENFADKKEVADKQLASLKKEKLLKKDLLLTKVNAIIQATINGASAMVATAGKIGFPVILVTASFVTALTATNRSYSVTTICR